jgi:beta-lactamase class C
MIHPVSRLTSRCSHNPTSEMTFPPSAFPRWLSCCSSAVLASIGTTLFPSETPAAGNNTAGLREVMDTVMRPMIAEHDIPGLVVALTINGRSSFFSYGVAAKDGSNPVDENTLFEIGSISKTFTATLASYAEVLGKLSFDDHPGRYLPELQGSSIDSVSLLHLGTYTAGGLPLQFPAEISDGKQMISYFQQWQPESAPGERRRYSNPSIGLFGHITARALKTDFSEAMEGQLLPALGLTRTYIRVPEPEMARYAWGYTAANQPVRVTPGVFDAEAYGIKSTAADMIRFVQINIDSTGLETPLRRAIEQTHAGFFKAGEMVQGLGWEQYPYPAGLEQLLAGNSRAMAMKANPVKRARAIAGPALFNKTGSTNGFGAYVAFVPEMRTGLVILANRNYPIPARVKAAHEILESVLKIRPLNPLRE